MLEVTKVPGAIRIVTHHGMLMVLDGDVPSLLRQANALMQRAPLEDHLANHANLVRGVKEQADD